MRELRGRSWGLAALVAAVALLCLQAGVARAAAIRHVATAAHGGNDNGGTNDCTNAASPCLTVQNAVNHAVNGDTIQIGPGIFPGSVTDMNKALTFAGAGAGSASSFDPATDTALDAVGTPDPGLTLGNRSVTLQRLRVRGGLEPDGMGGDVKPAVEQLGSTGPTLTITDSSLLQAAPPNPDVREYAVRAGGTKVVVQSSTVAGFENGIETSGTGGSLTIQHSSVLTPAPVNPPLSVGIRAAVTTFEPALITDSRLMGIAGLVDEDTSVTVLRSAVVASAGGAGLLDNGGGGSLALRDSVVDVVGGEAPFGAQAVIVSSQMTSEPSPPSLTLVGDTVLARSPGPTALDVEQAAADTRVNARNTILRAIDTSGLEKNADIRAGDQAIAWNVGYTDFTKAIPDGIAPAPGSGTNIDAPPGFVDDSGANLQLAPSSTMFDRGDPSVLQPGETDILGRPRSEPHSCTAPAAPDLGAFEAPPPPCPSGGPPPPPIPTLTAVSQSHRKWRAGGQLATIAAKKHKKHKHKAPVGTTFSFTLNTASQVTLTFTESSKGRKGKGGKCVAQTKRNKHKHACRRTVPAGTLSFPSAPAGADKIAFEGKLSAHRKLKPGKYTVAIEAGDSSGHSASTKLTFTVVKS